MVRRFFRGLYQFTRLYKKPAILLEEKEFTDDLDENLKSLKKKLGRSGRPCLAALESGKETTAVILYFETLVDHDLLGRQVIEPLNRRLHEVKGPLDAEDLRESP